MSSKLKGSRLLHKVTAGPWYLAGPFFNPPQKAWAEKIRDSVIDSDRHYYAPVEHMYQGGIHDKIKADEVYADNVTNLIHASVVLCQLDWLTCPGQEVRVVEVAGCGESFQILPASGPINIPDAGTVWEMGYAVALRNEGFRGPMKVIGYTSTKTDNLNLMLARSCDAFYNGFEALAEFIKTGTINPEDTFKGKVI